MPKVTALADVGSLVSGNKFYGVSGGSSSQFDWDALSYSVRRETVGIDTLAVEATGSGDEYTAFLSAWNAANSLNLARIILPPGRHTIGTQLPSLANGVTVEGPGQRACQLVFAHAGEGLRWSGVVQGSPVGNRRGPVFKGFAALPGHSSCSTAIKVSLASGSAPSYSTAAYLNLNLDINGSFQWTDTLIHNTDMPNALFEDVNGAGNGATQVGLKVDGFANSPRFMNCNIHLLGDGFVIGGETEGGEFFGCESIFTSRGIVKDVVGQEPLIYIAACHFNTSSVGIDLNNTPEASIIGNLIWGTTDGWIGIRTRHDGVSRTRAPRIIGNGFYGNKLLGTNSATCIKMEQAQNPIIEGNLFYEAGIGINLGNSASNAKIGTCNQFQGINAEIINVPLDTRYGGNIVPPGTWAVSSLRNARTASFGDMVARLGLS